MTVSVITPVYNEAAIIEENAKKLIAQAALLAPEAELLLISNGSTDATLEIAKKLSLSDPRIRVLSLSEKNLGAALKAGIRESRGEYIIWYPIDLSIGFEYFKSSLDTIVGCDLVVGSKEHPKSQVTRTAARKFLSLVYNGMVNLLFGLSISDTQCVKTFRASSTKPIAEETKSGGIVWEVELLYRAKKKGLCIREVPVKVFDMRKGSKIRPVDILKAFRNLILLRLRI
jgi:glycosyltransferase involved in cell wall biosynthesis